MSSISDSAKLDYVNTDQPHDPQDQRDRLRKAAHEYIEKGVTVLTGDAGEKHPSGYGWQERAGIAHGDVTTEVNATKCIYGRGGDNHFIWLDLDTPPERAPAIVKILGWTTAMDGRPSKPISHLIIKSANVPDNFTKSDEGDIEIRGYRHATMLPPSQHPSGEYLAFLAGHDIDVIAEIAWEEVHEQVNYARAVNAMANLWKRHGDPGRKLPRHDVALYIGGWLLRGDKSVDFTKHAIRDMIAVNGDPDGVRDDYIDGVDASKTRMDSGQPVGGYGKLIEHYDKDTLNDIRKWLKLPTTSMLDHRASITDFVAHLPDHKYMYKPTKHTWPAGSVNSTISPIVVGTDAKGKPVKIKPSVWLDNHAPIHQLIWSPGDPEIVEDRVLDGGGWIDHEGHRAFNTYRAPELPDGNPNDVDMWLELIYGLYPDDAEHILNWFAQRVQHPEVKINHALVFGGSQGIGKDTMLVPVRYAVGSSNFSDVSPTRLVGQYNSFVKSAILRVSEARDLGDLNRYTFYEHMKEYTAAPPETLGCNEKYIPTTTTLNVMGVIYTTNNRTTGLYLPADDRRHYVAWSEKERGDYSEDYWTTMHEWLSSCGSANVAAYLKTRDISNFDPKAPPKHTPAFWDIVDANRPTEEAELYGVIEKMGHPNALTIGDIISELKSAAQTFYKLDNRDSTGDAVAYNELAMWLSDRKNSRQIPHRLEAVGYVNARNPEEDGGRWLVGNRRGAIYVKKELPDGARIDAARARVAASRRSAMSGG